MSADDATPPRSAWILGGAPAMLRPLKGLMIALLYKHKASDSGILDYDA